MDNTDRDRLIQEMLERKQQADIFDEQDRVNIDIYALLFEALNSPPTEGIPYNFSSKVVAEIQARENYKRAFMRQLWLPVSGLATLMIMYFVLSATEIKLAATFFKFILDRKLFIAFAIVAYVVIEYVNMNVLLQLYSSKKTYNKQQ